MGGSSFFNSMRASGSNPLSSSIDFIAELTRAVNEVSKLTGDERTNLLLRAFQMIRDLRLETGVRHGHRRDTLRDLEIAALRAEHGTDEDAKKVLLETAEMIRTLKFVLDEKDDALRGE